MSVSQPKIKISLSQEHADFKPEVEEAFSELDVEVDANLQRYSEEELAVQLIIRLTDLVVNGLAWDCLKLGIKRTFTKNPRAQIVIRDPDSIMYAIHEDNTVSVIVPPDRANEFEHIKTLDDLIEHLKNKQS